MTKVTLEAPDISCDHCIASIQKAVTTLSGVQFLEGDPGKKQVTLEYDASVAKLEAIESAMAEEGYPVKK
jgi:copper chaperone